MGYFKSVYTVYSRIFQGMEIAVGNIVNLLSTEIRSKKIRHANNKFPTNYCSQSLRRDAGLHSVTSKWARCARDEETMGSLLRSKTLEWWSYIIKEYLGKKYLASRKGQERASHRSLIIAKN